MNGVLPAHLEVLQSFPRPLLMSFLLPGCFIMPRNRLYMWVGGALEPAAAQLQDLVLSGNMLPLGPLKYLEFVTAIFPTSEHHHCCPGCSRFSLTFPASSLA